MNARAKNNDARNKQAGGLCALTVDQIVYLAVMRLVCEGQRSMLFELDMTKLIAFGRFLITPSRVGQDPWKWLRDEMGIRITRSTVYRYVGTFRRAAYVVISETVTAETDASKPVTFPEGVETDRAVDPKDVKTR